MLMNEMEDDYDDLDLEGKGNDNSNSNGGRRKMGIKRGRNESGFDKLTDEFINGKLSKKDYLDIIRSMPNGDGSKNNSKGGSKSRRGRNRRVSIVMLSLYFYFYISISLFLYFFFLSACVACFKFALLCIY